MEWGVFLVIAALVSFLAIIVPPLIKLNTSITTLTVTMSSITGDLDELTNKNSKTHGRIFERLGEHDKELVNHDKRIHVLEKEKTK